MSVAAIGGIVAAGATIYSAREGSKASKRATKASEKAQVNPQEVADLAREQARQNVIDSLALEREFAPNQGAVRDQSLNALLQLIGGGDTTGATAIDSIGRTLTEAQNADPVQESPLLRAAIDRATADLNLGGELPVDVRNEVVRQGLANASRVGGGNLGTARSIVPRDLGLRSLDLRTNRLNTAATLGAAEQAQKNTASDSASRSLALRAQLAQILQQAGGNRTGQALGLAGFGQTLQPPEAGLGPGDVASLFVQNATNAATAGQNAAALKAQNARNNAEAVNSLVGLFQSNFNASNN